MKLFNRKTAIACSILLSGSTIAQKPGVDSLPPPVPPAAKEFPVKVDIYGFIRHDAFYDTRQVAGAGENIVPLYPRDIVLDANGNDINAAPAFHMLSVVSRAGLKIKGPDVGKAKLSGLLEGEFFGATEAGINEFRLRHAYIMLDWKNTQLGIGQFWHPFVMLDCLPNVVNYSTGSPIFALNRNPQVRVTQKLGKYFNVIGTLISQRDFTPAAASSAYRNGGAPAANLHLQFKSKVFVAGIAGHYENLRPQLSTTTTPVGGTPITLANNHRVESFSAMAYARLNTKYLQVSSAIQQMQNAASFVMLGGWVGYSLPGQTDQFRPIDTRSTWIDFQQVTTKKLAFGLFAGYVQNMGVRNPVAGATAQAYGVSSGQAFGAVSASANGRTVNWLYRIVPRVDFVLNKAFKFRFEVEHCTAQWANAEITGRGSSPINRIESTNYRFHLATFLAF